MKPEYWLERWGKGRIGFHRADVNPRLVQHAHVLNDVVRVIVPLCGKSVDLAFLAAHGFAPTTTYDLVWEERRYPPKAIMGTAYEFATGQRLASGDFEGGKSGAVKVLGQLGFTVRLREATLRSA